MQISGQNTIQAPIQEVWTALNTPDVLQQCIPGCQEMAEDGPNSYSVLVGATVGPIRAVFRGGIESEILAPGKAYRLRFKGSAGGMGSATGTANVELEPAAAGVTELSYSADVAVVGRIAQVGSRLIDTLARKLTGEFFSKFESVLTTPETPAPLAQSPARVAVNEAEDTKEKSAAGSRRWLWRFLALLLLLVIFLLLTRR